MLNKTILMLIIALCVLFIIFVVFVIILIVRAKKWNDWILMITATGDIIPFKGKFFNSNAFDLSIDGKSCMYNVDHKAIIRFGKRGRAAYYKIDSPSPIISNTKDNKKLEWDWVSAENIYNICNTKHVDKVAKCGEDKLSIADIIMIFGIVIVLMICIVTLVKTMNTDKLVKAIAESMNIVIKKG